LKEVYIDTNVILRLYENKSGKEDAEKIVLLARQGKIRLAISEWVINECVAAVQNKRNKNIISKEEAAEHLAGIADLIEGKIEEVNLSLYPVTEDVVRNSLITIQDVRCHSAGDAIHVYTADKSHCDYFVTAEEDLSNKIKVSNLGHRLSAVNIGDLNDLLSFLYHHE
jgi:predicted nucleic acid-binding protein